MKKRGHLLIQDILLSISRVITGIWVKHQHLWVCIYMHHKAARSNWDHILLMERLDVRGKRLVLNLCQYVSNMSQWEGGKMKGECCFQFPLHTEILTWQNSTCSQRRLYGWKDWRLGSRFLFLWLFSAYVWTLRAEHLQRVHRNVIKAAVNQRNWDNLPVWLVILNPMRKGFYLENFQFERTN